ncbi:TatD family hydrolase [Clostridium sp. D2Q-14]|uniref:TatD family hydrolase n=1 Tax=Anaeromonas gelatinilytica TaxID=2683194 RepID=UPI00193BEB94|nr:TatD family hydrolase [Anaeromonas gelatinilytica]MBS4535164.1 TatD family hydrolase [Anaeromonas gelatinilytica]
MLFDTHAHLDDDRFDKDRERIIENFKEDGIEMIVNPGADIASSVKAVSLAKKYENIYAAVGVHPHEVDTMDENTIEVLRELAQNEKVVAIGEIGLDYYYDNSPRDIQKKWFREQIRLAKEVDLPIIIHDRDAHEDTYNILKEENDDRLRGIMHCYQSSLEMSQQFIDLGFYISLAGPVTFKKAKTPKEVAAGISLDRLLIETDSPYLTPTPNRGKRNEPAYVRYVAGMIAELKGISYNEVVKQTNENAKKIFAIK